MKCHGKVSSLLFRASVAITLLLGSAVDSRADLTVVFNSFGPGNTYLTTVRWAVVGASTSGGYRGQAEWFVPGASGTLATLDLATFRQSGSGGANFFFAQDNGFGAPGSILESYLNVLSPNGLLTLNSASHPLLTAGVKYWLCAEPADSTAVNGWYENSQSYHPGFAFERSPWTWEAVTDSAHSPPSAVFRVSVVAVPEPSIGALILLGASLVAARLIRRPPAVRE